MYFRRIVTLLAALVLAVVAPLTDAAPAQFGARTLEIPAPAGFVPIREDVPAYFDFSQAYLPATNRLVEAFVLPESKAAMLAGEQRPLPRYFQLQVPRMADGVQVSASDLAAAMGMMEAEIQKQMATIDDEAAKLSAQGNEAMAARTQQQLQIGGVRMLGVYRREPWGLFFTTRINVTVENGGQSQTIPLVAANALVLVDHQLMYLYAYAQASQPDARATVEAGASAWADALRDAN